MIPGMTDDGLEIGPGPMMPIESFEAGKRVEISIMSDNGNGTVHGTILSGDKKQIKVVFDNGLLTVDHASVFRETLKPAPNAMAGFLKEWEVAKDTELESGMTINMVAFVEDYQNK